MTAQKLIVIDHDLGLAAAGLANVQARAGAMLPPQISGDLESAKLHLEAARYLLNANLTFADWETVWADERDAQRQRNAAKKDAAPGGEGAGCISPGSN